jgi:predicted nucleic acid-binding protein
LILVDSSVWIDFFRDIPTPQVDALDRMMGSAKIAVGDLVLTEVLQGFTQDRDFRKALELLERFPIVELGGRASALKAAQNYRALRRLGVTVRRTIDTLIASYCISNGHQLLYSDRDFQPFVEHLGLKPALALRLS